VTVAVEWGLVVYWPWRMSGGGGQVVARMGNLFRIPRNSAINPISDLLNSGIFIGILFFRL
jgi:hypothetical protein